MKLKRIIARIGELCGGRAIGCGLPSLGGGSSHLLVVFILSLSYSFILMLASCSGEHIVEPEAAEVAAVEEPQQTTETAIAFMADLPEQQAVTRSGVPLSETGVNSFMTWGYKNMSLDAGSYGGLQEVFAFPSSGTGFEVRWQAGSAATTTTNSRGWEYILADKPEQTIKYWDWGAKAYRFFGVTNWGGTLPADPSDYEANKAYGTNEANAYRITMQADASSTTVMDASPYFSRLWFSDGNAATYPDKQFGQPVTLEFVKPYARVRFMFMYVFPRVGYNMGTKRFHPTDDTNIIRKGTVTVVYPKSGTQTMEQYEVEGNADPDPTVSKALAAFTEDYDPENDVYTESVEGWYTVLPNTSQGSYTLTANINGSDRTVVVPAQFMQWKPGYQYTYVFKVTEEGGVEIGWVEYAVRAWTEMEADWNVYNW